MAEERDADSGQFVAEYSEEAMMRVFDAVEGPSIMTRDVERELGCSLETARQKLISLNEQGRVGRRKVGGRSLWWKTEDSDDE